MFKGNSKNILKLNVPYFSSRISKIFSCNSIKMCLDKYLKWGYKSSKLGWVGWLWQLFVCLFSAIVFFFFFACLMPKDHCNALQHSCIFKEHYCNVSTFVS